MLAGHLYQQPIMGAQVSTTAGTNLALIRMWLEGNRQTGQSAFEGGAQAGMSYIIAPLPVCLTAVAQLGWLVLSRHVRRQLDATSREGAMAWVRNDAMTLALKSRVCSSEPFKRNHATCPVADLRWKHPSVI